MFSRLGRNVSNKLLDDVDVFLKDEKQKTIQLLALIHPPRRKFGSDVVGGNDATSFIVNANIETGGVSSMHI